jgi:hypothetical protein
MLVIEPERHTLGMNIDEKLPTCRALKIPDKRGQQKRVAQSIMIHE